MNKKIISSLLITIFVLNIFQNIALCQNDSIQDFYSDNFIRYSNFIYKKNIKTMMIYRNGWELSEPIIDLNSNDKIKLTFDDLDGGVKTYCYKIIHCNEDWQPSDIVFSDYLEGIEQNIISDYELSFNTNVNYTHYQLIFPNEDVKPTASGNYIIKVFEDYNEENLILTARFYIVEYLFGIDAEEKRPTLIDNMKSHQEIDFVIHKNSIVNNPFSEVKVNVLQNNRYDNAINSLKPIFVKDNDLIYDYDEDNLFSGGSEFRYFNCNSVRFQTERIKKIRFENSNYYFDLFDDEKTTYKLYSYHNDINGKYKIDVEESNNIETEADYVYVNFSLKSDLPYTNGNLYVGGELTYWKFDNENKMIYDYKNKTYNLTLLLKQAYYNYQYIFVKDGKTAGDETVVEGSHFDTENDYQIFVYFRNPASRFDKLVGYKKFNSMKVIK